MTVIDTPLEHLPRLPFWTHLTAEERLLLENRSYYLQYRQGQQLRSAGTQCLGVLLVLSGTLRTYLLSPDGREMTLSRTRSGETYLLTAACVLESISFDTQVDAEEDCEVLLIPSDVFSVLVEQNLQVECDSYKMLADGYADVVSSIERLIFLSLEQRIASFLLDESANTGTDQLQMTHEQIAVSIGSARVAVNRTLHQMAKKGLVELSRGSIQLANKAAMYQLLRN